MKWYSKLRGTYIPYIFGNRYPGKTKYKYSDYYTNEEVRRNAIDVHHCDWKKMTFQDRCDHADIMIEIEKATDGDDIIGFRG